MPSIDPALPPKAQAFVVQFENGVSEQMSVNQIRSLMVSTTQERTSVTQDELNTGLRRISPTLFNLSREEMAEIWVHLDPENTGQVSAEKLTAVMAELPQHSRLGIRHWDLGRGPRTAKWPARADHTDSQLCARIPARPESLRKQAPPMGHDVLRRQPGGRERPSAAVTFVRHSTECRELCMVMVIGTDAKLPLWTHECR